MQEIPENGEFKTVGGKDEGVETGLKTYGKKFGFSRQTIINDDLGTVSRLITAQVRSNQRFINQKCYEALTKNAKIYDGKNLFDASHHNLFTGAEPSIASFNEMIVAMSQQKDIDNKGVLNIKPRFVLAPVALGMAIRQILESTADPNGANSGVVNPMRGAFQLITDAQLDIANPEGYYAVADPNDVDTIEVTYLNGKRTPTLESRASWDTLVIEYRWFHDFGINIIDYRGMSYNPANKKRRFPLLFLNKGNFNCFSHSSSKSLKCFQGWIGIPIFQLADIGLRDAGQLRELFLCESHFFTGINDGIDDGKLWFQFIIFFLEIGVFELFI